MANSSRGYSFAGSFAVRLPVRLPVRFARRLPSLLRGDGAATGRHHRSRASGSAWKSWRRVRGAFRSGAEWSMPGGELAVGVVKALLGLVEMAAELVHVAEKADNLVVQAPARSAISSAFWWRFSMSQTLRTVRSTVISVVGVVSMTPRLMPYSTSSGSALDGGGERRFDGHEHHHVVEAAAGVAVVVSCRRAS